MDVTDTQTTPPLNVVLPRIAIQFCTQCRWMLRAAYVSLFFPFIICTVVLRGGVLSFFWYGVCVL